MVKPRVFVSSVIDGFRDVRQVAREGILTAGGEPILVNEDFPALAASSRNVCLDAVDSSDIYLVIVGERGGWTTPSGKLVVEEEYERARQRRLPMLVLVRRGTRDADADRFLASLSDYVGAMFRREFSTLDELRDEVERAVAPLVKQLTAPVMNTALIIDRLAQRRTDRAHKLRFALIPERDEEVIDVVRLGDSEFSDLVNEIGHRRDVRLFTYEAPKATKLGRDTLVVRQEAVRRREAEIPEVQVELAAGGMIYVETDVTQTGVTSDRFFGGMMIVRSDVEALLRAAFAFANAWYAQHDPYRRHQRFYYGVALAGVENRKWVDAAPQSNSFAVRMGSTPDPYVVFDRPRLIGWQDLASPDDEIKRVATLAARTLS